MTVVSFTFGLPTEAAVEAVRSAGSELWDDGDRSGTRRLPRWSAAWTCSCCRAWRRAATNRPSTTCSTAPRDSSLLALLRLVAAEIDLPLIAAGGISDGAAVAAVLAAGAIRRADGHRVHAVPEAATTAAHRAAIVNGGAHGLTRAFSGRTARGIVNRFQAEYSRTLPRLSAHPPRHLAAACRRARARRRGRLQPLGRSGTPPGSGGAGGRHRPAAQLRGGRRARPGHAAARGLTASAKQAAEQARRPRLGLPPFVAARQPPGPAGGRHALRVCVAAPRGIALGGDEHVLAERGEEAATERAAVGGGLAVLCPPHRPPGRLLELRHDLRLAARERSRAPTGPSSHSSLNRRLRDSASSARRLIRPRCQPPRARR